ncbi:hypothetical protein N0V90_005827 [Kalmusia sp. IMI 367209]|nr:hypothetical protein N0V90_005827 [Kalmusia sp. IMI 367209]
MTLECVICGEAQSEETQLLELPCFNHWVCKDDIASFFENATSNESLFPPACCDEPVLLDRFVEHVPEDVQLAFLFKEQGEYTILPKYRVYCANPKCGKFLHPNGHIRDADSDVTYVVCDSDECFQATCVSCKGLLVDGVQGHICVVAEHDKKFKDCVNEQGYKECSVCGVTVELAEACNHITCECGNSFCYICGKQWQGMHGCPQYGPANYDEEGYNADGFHRDTGLNRDGRTRREQFDHERGEDNEEDREGDDDGGDVPDEEEDLWNQVLQHVDPARRAFLEGLDPNTREEVLIQIQIELIDQGITFTIPQPQDNAQLDGENDHDEDDDEDGDDENEDEDEGEGGDGDEQEDEEAEREQDRGNDEEPIMNEESLDNLIADDGVEGGGDWNSPGVWPFVPVMNVDDGIVELSDAGSNDVPFIGGATSWDTASSAESPATLSDDAMDVDNPKTGFRSADHNQQDYDVTDPHQIWAHHDGDRGDGTS